MAVITVDIAVPDPIEALLYYDQLKIYRSVTGQGGVYTEITTPATRLVISKSVSMYAYTDINGHADYYYKMSYYNSVSSAESDLSNAYRGEGDPALSIVTIEEIKAAYLFGLDLTQDDGTPFPDIVYEMAIKSAVSWLEHQLDISILPKFIDDERLDYYQEDYPKFIWLKLDHKPVIGVDAVSMVLPGSNVARVYPQEWLSVHKLSGQVQIVPGDIGSIAAMRGGDWYPLHTSHRLIPDVFRVKYSAGFNEGEVPWDIKDLVGKIASFGPLNIAGDLLGGAGIASQNISLDGLSMGFNTTSSATNAGYGARLVQYNKEIKAMIPTLRRYYNGAGMVVV